MNLDVESTHPDFPASLISPIPAAVLLASPLKLGVLASGSGSNFEAIAQAIAVFVLKFES